MSATHRAGDLADLAVRWGPRPYPQLLRGPGYRWWRPLLGLAVAAAGIGLLLFGSVLAYGLVALVLGRAPSEQELLTSPLAFLGNNLLLASLIPLAWLAVWAGHGVRPRWLSSVRGGLRWRWLLLSGVLPAVVVVLGVGGAGLLGVLAGEEPFGSGDQRTLLTTVVLLLVVLLTTPLQAAGEEYFFRGWMSQAVGAWFRRPVVGALVAAAVSAVLFGLAHGDQDPWLYADRFLFGLTASYLVWRTGGLETAIAFHTVNNVVIFVPTVLAGGLGDALDVSSAPPSLVLVDAAGFAVIAVGTAWLARRRGLVRLTVPPRVESSLGAVTSPAPAGVTDSVSASTARDVNHE